MGVRVYTIESNGNFLTKHRQYWVRWDIQLTSFLATGTWESHSTDPYDGILVTAAAPEVPEQLLEQLKIEGGL
ncbi:MAG: hypothetical protein R2727_05525 [Bacteroidales bacterium]